MEHKEWDFDSGNLVLDFTNTAEFHASDNPDEKLESYLDLVSWSQAAGLLNKTESRDLLRLVDREPGKAEKTLENALNLREIIYLAGG